VDLRTLEFYAMFFSEFAGLLKMSLGCVLVAMYFKVFSAYCSLWYPQNCCLSEVLEKVVWPTFFEN
jgi:hypothetical protein